jgi:hypothetical protein
VAVGEVDPASKVVAVGVDGAGLRLVNDRDGVNAAREAAMEEPASHGMGVGIDAA